MSGFTAGACIATGIISADRVSNENRVILRIRNVECCSEGKVTDLLAEVN